MAVGSAGQFVCISCEVETFTFSKTLCYAFLGNFTMLLNKKVPEVTDQAISGIKK